jgi:Ca-activated chloride channel family protein
VAQVGPETVELPVLPDGQWLKVRLGDLMTEPPRIVLVNLYITQLSLGKHPIVNLQVRCDAHGSAAKAESEIHAVVTNVVSSYQPVSDPQVQQHILMLAKYRQTQIAEARLRQGDRIAALTMLQTAATTALQLGDPKAAAVLQENISQLRSGAVLSESTQKKTRMASKTMMV